MTIFHNHLQTNYPAILSQPLLADGENHTLSLSHYQSFVTVLCQYSCFLLKGQDSNTFLQGQLCGDVNTVSDQQALMTAHATPKGRIFASLMLTKQADSWLAFARQSNAKELLERLKKYILFSKLTIEDVSQDYILLECGGQESQTALADYLPELPETPAEARHCEHILAIRQPGELPRWLLCISDPQTAIDVWEALAASHQPTPSAIHDYHNCSAGYVPVGATLQERFLPQMIGLADFRGLSFKKGCFVGQEVIARTEHLGKLKKKRYSCTVPNISDIQVGDDLLDDSGTAMGTCVGVNPVDGKLLAVITTRALDAPLYCKEQRVTVETD